MNKTNRIVFTALTAIALLALPTGCGTLTQDQKLAQVHNLCYAAASMGTQIALAENEAWRPQFETAYNDLNQLVQSKVVTGLLLRQILASLPVKELKSKEAVIAIESATMLYDMLVGDKLNIEAQPYVLAAATGIRDGMRIALNK